MSHLAISDLVLGYRGQRVLDGLDLHVARGEILVLLGPSGAGKTTLLRVLGGFLTPEQGRVVLAGQDITATPPHRRRVTTMFQSYALFPHMDVAANIGFGLRRQGMARGAVAARVAELLGVVRLDGLGARRIGEISGGQQQRVALARCLAPQPDLLLLDEPLSALDPDLREATRGELVGLLRRTGTTAILVTHDQEEALAVADRIGVLHQGRLAQIGTPAELYERPANSFVARFLGGANLLPAEIIVSGPDGTHLALPGGAAMAAPSALPPGTRLTLALRPERLRLAGPAAEAVNFLAGTLVDVAYGGATIGFSVALASGDIVRLRQALDGSVAVPERGAACTITWARDAAILLAG